MTCFSKDGKALPFTQLMVTGHLDPGVLFVVVLFLCSMSRLATPGTGNVTAFRLQVWVQFPLSLFPFVCFAEAKKICNNF